MPPLTWMDGTVVTESGTDCRFIVGGLMQTSRNWKSATVIDRLLKRVVASRKFRGLRQHIVGATTLHCIGDSHLMYFERVARENLWLHTEFKFCVVQGATATGLANPHSQTDALAIFARYIDSQPVDNPLLFCLGEVDCGFVIWYRAAKYGIPISEQFQTSLKNYCAFIDGVYQKGHSNIIISSVPFPTIIDGQDWGKIANLRREVRASLVERTQLTMQYNERLHLYCINRGFQYLDISGETLDQESGGVKDKFRNPDPFDHHLNPKSMSSIIAPKLRYLGYW